MPEPAPIGHGYTWVDMSTTRNSLFDNWQYWAAMPDEQAAQSSMPRPTSMACPAPEPGKALEPSAPLLLITLALAGGGGGGLKMPEIKAGSMSAPTAGKRFRSRSRTRSSDDNP